MEKTIKNLTSIQIFWKNLYRKYLNIDIDPSIIEDREGKWPIFVSQGLGNQEVFNALPFEKGGLNDLDLFVERGRFRWDYVVYVDQNIEADEEFANLSAIQFESGYGRGIDLVERLLLELFYYEKTGEHLDVENITLCVGDLMAGGRAPGVMTRDNKFIVGWGERNTAKPNLRARKIELMNK